MPAARWKSRRARRAVVPRCRPRARPRAVWSLSPSLALKPPLHYPAHHPAHGPRSRRTSRSNFLSSRPKFPHPERGSIRQDRSPVEGRTNLLRFRPSPRKRAKGVVVASDQRLFLGPAPVFHLTLGGNAIRDTRELLMKDEYYRSSACRISTEYPIIVLSDAKLKTRPRRADVIGAIGAT